MHWRVTWSSCSAGARSPSGRWRSLSGGSADRSADARGAAGAAAAVPGRRRWSGSGGLTAAVDAYGNVVDLRRRAGGPGADRQPGRAAGGRDGCGRTPGSCRGSAPARPALPLWRADSVAQRYRPDERAADGRRFGSAAVEVVDAARGGARLPDVARRRARVSIGAVSGRPRSRLRCDGRRARAIVARRRARGPALAGPGAAARPGAPAWAERLYRRSLLTCGR